MNTNLEAFDTKGTYDTAAPDYLVAMQNYWTFIGVNTVDRLKLRPGARLLDVGCGPAPAAIHAARQVGPTGYVEGIDVVEAMLAIARKQATEAGLDNITFAWADFDDLAPGDGSFDAVTCSIALFFAKHIDQTLRSLMTYLRPGGVIGISTVTSEMFEPVMPVYLSACRTADPNIGSYIPWSRLTDTDVLRALLEGAGATDVKTDTEVTSIPLTSSEVWWRIVQGSGLRHFDVALSPTARVRVRDTVERWIAEQEVTDVILPVNYATAAKPETK